MEWKNRMSGNDSLIMERAVGTAGVFVELTRLAPDATEYRDLNVTAGGIYTYPMYTTAADGRLIHDKV